MFYLCDITMNLPLFIKKYTKLRPVSDSYQISNFITKEENKNLNLSIEVAEEHKEVTETSEYITFSEGDC